MTIVKSVLGACTLLLVAAGAAGLLSGPEPGGDGAETQAAGGYPPKVDMSPLQSAFNR